MENIIHRIEATLKEACSDNCQCCQSTTTDWLHDLGWQWLEVEGPNAKVRFGFRIAETRLEVFSRPGVLSNCMLGSKKLEAPESPPPA